MRTLTTAGPTIWATAATLPVGAAVGLVAAVTCGAVAWAAARDMGIDWPTTTPTRSRATPVTASAAVARLLNRERLSGWTSLASDMC